MNKLFSPIWTFRHFILSSIKAEFHARFIRSRLGTLWLIINPLAQAAMFALVLAKLMSAKLPGINTKFSYSVYLLSGMLAWTLFTEVVNRCLTMFIEKANLLKKIAFPRICLPLIIAGSSLFNNLLLFFAMTIVFIFLGHFPTATLLWIPVLTLLTLAFSLGIGLILGILNVFMRDIGQIVPILIQLGFWATPIVYTLDVVPSSIRPLLHLNPMTLVVQTYQQVILLNTSPTWDQLLYLSFGALAILTIGLFLFHRANPELVDVL